MIMLNTLGIVIAISIVMYLSMKGVSSIITGPLASLIILVSGGFNFTDFSGTYATGFANTVKGLLLLYFASIAMSEIMMRAGMIQSIANWIADTIGADHVVMVCIIGVGILSFGGLGNAAYITMYWVGVVLCSKANVTRNHIAAACMTAAWGFSNVLPFIPNNANGVLNNVLKTGADAGMISGLATGVVQFILMSLYLTWVHKKLKAEGKTFDSWELITDTSEDKDLPSVFVSLVPLIVVLVLYNFAKLSIISSMFICCIVATILGIKKLKSDWYLAWQKGFTDALQPICKTAAMAAIGACIAITPAFKALLEMADSANMSPYLMTVLFVEIVGACLGTAGGAVNTGVAALQPSIDKWVGMGYDIGVIHRMIAIGSMGLSALPHSGGINSTIAIYKTNFHDTYKYIFVTVAVIPTITAFLVGLPLALLGFK